MTLRIGTGFDAHHFDPAATLFLAGAEWPGEPGLAGHSDGDAVLHAMVDALLSAAQMGDIGHHFGTADPKMANISSSHFLSETLDKLRAANWEVVNLSVQIIGERPKIAPRRAELERALSTQVGAPVSLSATTTDGMGFTGRGEGLAVIATALIRATGSAA